MPRLDDRSSLGLAHVNGPRPAPIGKTKTEDVPHFQKIRPLRILGIPLFLSRRKRDVFSFFCCLHRPFSGCKCACSAAELAPHLAVVCLRICWP